MTGINDKHNIKYNKNINYINKEYILITKYNFNLKIIK